MMRTPFAPIRFGSAYAAVKAKPVHLLGRAVTFHAMGFEERLDIAPKVNLRGNQTGTRKPRAKREGKAKSTSR